MLYIHIELYAQIRKMVLGVSLGFPGFKVNITEWQTKRTLTIYHFIFLFETCQYFSLFFDPF